MKTIKIKISLTREQETTFNQYTSELDWLWNTVLSNQLHNHCISWYNWMSKVKSDLDKVDKDLDKLKPEKQELVRNYYKGIRPSKLSDSDKKLVAKFDIYSRWSNFSLDGITPVPLRLGNSGYEGLSCQIATGGSYWKRDDNFNIPVNSKKGLIYVKGTKLVKGDKPWQRINIEPHGYRVFPSGKFEGRELTDIMKFDNLAGLNSLRACQNLPDLTIPTDFIGGMLEYFKVSWEAFLNPKLLARRKPKFRNKDHKIESLSNNQSAPKKIDTINNKLMVSGLGFVEIMDKNWLERLDLDNITLRTYTINKRPSGYYINIVVAHPKQIEKAKLTKQLPKVKKEFGEDSLQYQEIVRQLELVNTEIAKSQHKKLKDLSVGIDPGVSAIASTDHGALFLPNLTRERISIHIEELQSRLNKIKDNNDQQWKLAGNKGIRPKTKNEVRLQAKISRLQEEGAKSSNCFNHKLSTRISSTYKDVCWEDTQLTNLLKQTDTIALPEGAGYAPNGASAKRGLNWIMRQRCLGDLKAKTKNKVEVAGGNFHEPSANYSSQFCHCCGQKGERVSQHEFVCKNNNCELFEKIQQADINAARNHKKNSGFELGTVKYNNVKLTYQKPKRFKKKRLTT